MLIIGIAGGSGSGKTTVVKTIIEKLKKERVRVIPQDSYYKDSSDLTDEEKRVHNFDHPDSIDWELLNQQLKELKEGKTIEQPVYSYISCTRSKTEKVIVEPADVIIVEGILILANKELRDQLDIKIFVDADDDDRLMRVISRDIKEMKIVKTAGGYRIPSKASVTPRPYHAESVLSYEPVHYGAIIKTVPGHANMVASIIDAASISPAAGTIAGDDTIFVIIRNGFTDDDLIETLEGLLPGIGRKRKAAK